jgi:hypothetical protein
MGERKIRNHPSAIISPPMKNVRTVVQCPLCDARFPLTLDQTSELFTYYSVTDVVCLECSNLISIDMDVIMTIVEQREDHAC